MKDLDGRCRIAVSMDRRGETTENAVVEFYEAMSQHLRWYDPANDLLSHLDYLGGTSRYRQDIDAMADGAWIFRRLILAGHD